MTSPGDPPPDLLQSWDSSLRQLRLSHPQLFSTLLHSFVKDATVTPPISAPPADDPFNLEPLIQAHGKHIPSSRSPPRNTMHRSGRTPAPTPRVFTPQASLCSNPGLPTIDAITDDIRGLVHENLSSPEAYMAKAAPEARGTLNTGNDALRVSGYDGTSLHPSLLDNVFVTTPVADSTSFNLCKQDASHQNTSGFIVPAAAFLEGQPKAEAILKIAQGVSYTGNNSNFVSGNAGNPLNSPICPIINDVDTPSTSVVSCPQVSREFHGVPTSTSLSRSKVEASPILADGARLTGNMAPPVSGYAGRRRRRKAAIGEAIFKP